MASFRVFISSTFKNFEYERNYLAQNLYNSLDLSCRRNGYAFHAIDLRWGISTEASLDNKSMLLCLDEIKKCQETNIKPNFLIMLGDYYGWKPLPFTIEESEAQKILPELDSFATELFEKCYELDTNNIPHEYVLQGRQGELVDNSIWSNIETKLHDALEIAAKKVLPEEKQGKYIYSATHQEIIEGFLKDDIIKDYTFVFIKEEGNIYNNEGDYLNAKRLKEKTLAVLPENQYAIYKNDEDFSLAVKKAEEFLQQTIAKQTEKLADTDKQIMFLKGLMDNYIPDEALEEQIIKSIEEKHHRKIYVVADKYAGKTSLLLNLYYRLKSSTEQRVHLWCANSDQEHLSALDLCRFIIKKSTRGRQNPYIEYDNACYFVQKVLCDQSEESASDVFLIDGIESLFDFYKIESMFKDIVLPQNSAFVLTTSSHSSSNQDLQFYIQAFDENKKEKLFDAILSDSKRTITGEQRSVLLPMISSGNPLLVRFLANKAKKVHSYDVIETEMSSIDAFITNEIKYLSTPTMYGEVLVSRILLFLAFSPYGVSETEMLGLLKMDRDVVSFLKSTANWDFDEEVGIPKVVLYRIISDISPYIAELNDKGDIVYKFNSQYLTDVVLNLYAENTVKSLYTLYKEYFKKRRVYINSKKQIDQRIARQWLYITSKEESELIDGLNSLDFCDACIKLGEMNYLINGFKSAGLIDSHIYKTIIRHLGQLLVFRDMFLTYIVSENVSEIDNYKKVNIEYGDDSIQKITNWMNDKLEFCHILSKDKYVITCENALMKIDQRANEVIDKITFNAQVEKCCLSNDSNTLLVACANSGLENSVLNLYFVNLEKWEVNNQSSRIISIQGSLNTSSLQIFSYNNDFVVIASAFLPDSGMTSQWNIYHLTSQSCFNIASIDALLLSAVPVSNRYLLIRTGLNKIRLFDLEEKQFILSKGNLKYLKLDLNNSIVAEDGNTYCVIEANGVFKLSVQNGRLKVHKSFSLVPTTALQDPSMCLLKNCFLLKQGGSTYTDIYTYEGLYIGKFDWDGKSYVLDMHDNKVQCVDIGGKLFERLIDTTITFNQKNVQISLSEFWRAATKVFRRLSNAFNRYEQPQNTKKLEILSPSGKYRASLTRDAVTILEDGNLIFEYLYKSKNPDARDICFVGEHLILWKQSYKKFLIIDIDKKIIKDLYRSSKKMYGYVVIGDSLYLSNSMSLNWDKQKFDSINNAVARLEISSNKENSVEKLNLDINCYDSLEMVKGFRKRKEAKIVFTYAVPSALQFNELENDQIICITNEYIVRLLNHRLFFYSYESKEEFKISYAFNSVELPNGSKIASHENVLYCYIEPLKTILIYNELAKQTIQYLLDDSVCDVVFDNNMVRILHRNGNIDIITID